MITSRPVSDRRFRAGSYVLILLVGLFASLPAAASDDGADALRRLLASAEASPARAVRGERVHAMQTLKRFYAGRSHVPAWSRGGHFQPVATRFLEWLSGLERHGIDATDYHLMSLGEILRTAADPAPSVLAEADLLLTDAWLLIASHLYSGRINPETIDPEWFSNRRDRDFAVLLGEALSADEAVAVLDTLHPAHPGYLRLVGELDRLRSIVAGGGWPRVPTTGKFEAGNRGPGVRAIRDRLRVTGELSAPVDGEGPESFDETLRGAVMTFQARNGLDADGVAGRRTLAAMNVSAAERARQLRVNLERWRWLPQHLGERHVLVNIAGYYLDLVENDRSLLHMDVIVGRPARSTPVFSGSMTYMVFNPRWDVPHKLAVQDKLPDLQADPSALARGNFVVLPRGAAHAAPLDPAGIDWTRLSASNFPYRLRQLPGPNNALGRVKFMFPNRFNVYLHDTPARELFSHSQRAFSSGCIRLSRPLELARALLDLEPASAGVNIESLLDGGKETVVRLPRPVPVHLLHWTAWVAADGALHFREDLYGRDALVWEAIERKPGGAGR